ncbi:MAG: hypothetical protein D6729_16455 [Deltaproteobacteria bacterium]|nr:MAG: hypothetical protein D6729_16455 [Deltaproteobacteria bacterium]
MRRRGQRTPDRIVAVGGGKGGVGKSVVASNLAIAMAQAGRRVVLLDADLGAANLHTLFGITRPARCLAGFLSRAQESLEEVRIHTAVPGLDLIPGAGAVPGVANPGWGRKQRLLRHIRSLDADVVVLDVGAGTSFDVVDLYNEADLRLVVMTPQLTSVQNAYAFTKAAVYRLLDRLAGERAQLGGSEVDRVEGRLRATEAADPALAARMRAALSGAGFRLVGNQTFEQKDGRVYHALSRMIFDFLSVQAPVMGWLWASRRIHDSVSGRIPHLLVAPGDPNEVTLRSIADALLREDVAALRAARAAKHPARERSGAAPETGKEALEILRAYMAQSERRPVDWTATLELEDTPVEVAVRDISSGGARIKSPVPLSRGQEAALVLDQVPGAPRLRIVVRNAREATWDYGVEFISEPVPTQDATRTAAEVDLLH